MTFDGPRRELAITKQMNLVLPDIVRAQKVRRAAKISRKILNRTDVGTYGVRGVVATLSFRAGRPVKPHENLEL